MKANRRHDGLRKRPIDVERQSIGAPDPVNELRSRRQSDLNAVNTFVVPKNAAEVVPGRSAFIDTGIKEITGDLGLCGLRDVNSTVTGT
eukprot:12627760-Heterocapsa_arctica.AAC.1